MIRKLEKIKTLQGFKKFSGWRSKRNLQWVMQGMSYTKQCSANFRGVGVRGVVCWVRDVIYGVRGIVCGVRGVKCLV